MRLAGNRQICHFHSLSVRYTVLRTDIVYRFLMVGISILNQGGRLERARPFDILYMFGTDGINAIQETII
jgi:hypothetical protein